MCLYPYLRESERLALQEKTKLWEYPLLVIVGVIMIPVLLGSVIRKLFY